MNKAIIMGRLTKDPDFHEGENPFARYTIAVDRRVRRDNNDPNAQTADFISCVAFGKRAEFAQNYLRKGTKIVLVGHIQTGKYTNRDGQTVYTTDVVVDEQEFAESKKAAGDTTAPAPLPEGDFVNIPDNVDEELPFH